MDRHGPAAGSWGRIAAGHSAIQDAYRGLETRRLARVERGRMTARMHLQPTIDRPEGT